VKDIQTRVLLSGGLAVGAGTTVVSDVGPVSFYGDPVTNTVFYVTSNASQTTGTIKIEEASTATEAGTWVTIATVTCATATTVQVVRQAGEMVAVRARVTATANGSGITVLVKAS